MKITTWEADSTHEEAVKKFHLILMGEEISILHWIINFDDLFQKNKKQ